MFPLGTLKYSYTEYYVDRFLSLLFPVQRKEAAPPSHQKAWMKTLRDAGDL